MTTKQIKDAYEALHWVFDSEMVNYARRLLQRCKEEEREHRGFLPDFHSYHDSGTVGINDAARLFAVKRVAEYLLKPETYPTGKDYLHFQTSCFIAAGIADEFGAKVRKAWADFDLQELATLNYTDFVKVKAVA